jgi:hypothetical protein
VNTSLNALQSNLQNNQKTIKQLLPSEDILSYAFQSQDGTNCALFYADGVVNKELLGELVIKPLSALSISSSQKETLVLETLRFPELKTVKTFQDAVKEILD